MPKIIEKCVKSVEKKIKAGDIHKFFTKKGKKTKTSPWAICKSAFGLTNNKN